MCVCVSVCVCVCVCVSACVCGKQQSFVFSNVMEWGANIRKRVPYAQ